MSYVSNLTYVQTTPLNNITLSHSKLTPRFRQIPQGDSKVDRTCEQLFFVQLDRLNSKITVTLIFVLKIPKSYIYLLSKLWKFD